MVVNARHMKAVPGRKTDVKDAEWIADLLQHGLLQPSYIPDKDQRELRELVRYRKSLVGERTRELNRLQKMLEGANIKRVLSSFQNIVAFHNADYDTRCFLMNRFGANYQNLSFSSQQSNIHTQREGHKVEDNDILSLGLGEAIVSLKNEAPFFFRMPQYH